MVRKSMDESCIIYVYIVVHGSSEVFSETRPRKKGRTNSRLLQAEAKNGVNKFHGCD